jgi:hypothetical protein
MRTVKVRAVTTFGRTGLVLLVVLSALLVPTAACAGRPALSVPAAAQPSAPPVAIAPAERGPGAAVPAPTGPALLTLTGKITRTNGDGSLRFDRATLDQLGQVQVTVYEPWVKRELQFQGTWLADVLKVAEPESSAGSIHLTALDNYQIDLSMPDVNAGGILLATKTGDGAPIPIEDGGPLRIVFVGGAPSGSSADQWIWSLSMIDVR